MTEFGSINTAVLEIRLKFLHQSRIYNIFVPKSLMDMTRENEILQFLHYHPASTRSEIETGMDLSVSPVSD